MADDATTVDEYVAQFPPEIAERLREMRAIVREHAPAAAETISWGMPTYRLRGNLVHFAANKAHLGFYPGAGAVAHFADALADYTTTKGGIQLPYARPLPRELVARIVDWRVAQQSPEGEATQ